MDALRTLESEGALIVSGNTDIAVGDFDYGAAFPHLQDGVPETISVAAEWAHDELGDEQVLRERDRIDSGRAVAPLALADGAVQIDTTAYTLDEVIGLVVGLVAADREAPR